MPIKEETGTGWSIRRKAAMGTGWQIRRGNTEKASKAQRWISPQEEVNLIRSNWIADRATPSTPKPKKVEGAPPVSSHTGTPGPQTPKAPARSATPSATSRGMGQAAPPTRMHTPTTTRRMGTSYAGPKPEELMGQAADDLFPGVSTEGLNKLSEPEKRSITDKAYKLEEEHREGRARPRQPVIASGLKVKSFGESDVPSFKTPTLESPGVGLGSATGYGVAAVAVGGTSVGAYKLTKGVLNLGKRMGGAALGKITGSRRQSGAMPAPSPAAQAAPASPTGVAPKINPALKAYGGMPAASQAAPTSVPKPSAGAGNAALNMYTGQMPTSSTRTPAATAMPPTGASMPKPAAKPAKPKIEQAMDLAKQIQGEKAAAEAGKAAKHEVRVQEVVKSVTKAPATAGMPTPPTAPKLGSPEGLARVFGTRPPKKETTSPIKPSFSTPESGVTKFKPAPIPAPPKPADVVPQPVTPPRAAPRLGGREQLNIAFAKAGGSMPKPSAVASGTVPAPVAAGPAPKPAKGRGRKPSMPEGVTIPQAAMPTPQAAPAPVVLTGQQQAEKALADEIRQELKKPSSPERDVKLQELKSRGKDLLIKRGGIQIEETPAGQQAPQKPKTKVAPMTPRQRGERGAAPGVKSSVAEAARIAQARVNEAGVEQPVSPPKPALELSPEQKAARAPGVAEQYRRARTKLGDILPEGIKDALKKIGQQAAASAPESTRRAPEAALAAGQDIRTARVRRQPLGPVPASVEQAVGPRRAPPASAAPPREGVQPRKTKKVGRARPDINIPEGQEDFVSKAAQKAQRKAQAAAGERPARRAGGINIETEVASSLRGESPEQIAERITRKAAIEQHKATKGFTKIETPTIEQELAGEKPAAVRVGPAGKPAPAQPEGMPTPTKKAKPAKAKAAPKGKEPGRFRFPKPKAPKVPKVGGALGVASSIFEAFDWAKWQAKQAKRRKQGYSPEEGGGLL